MINILKLCLYLFFGLIMISSGTSLASEGILTPQESKWLSDKNNTILVRPENNYPPFVFKGGLGMQGLGIDYLEIIAKKIGVKIQYFEPSPLSSIIESVKGGKSGVIVAITKNSEREEYLNFTEPFIKVPAVIVLRKDSLIKDKNLTLNDFSGKIVAVGKSYAVESYIKNNYSKVIIEDVVDDEIGIQKLLLGEVDAAVMDLASLSYYTSQKALPYVSVAGQTGFEYELGFAISKDMPELVNIFDKTLQTINPQERLILRDKWITFRDSDEIQPSVKSFVSENNSLFIVIIFLSIFFMIIIYLLMRNFSKTQSLLIKNIWGRPTKNSDPIDQKFKELEQAKHAIEEELSHIEEIEKDIKKEIQ